MTPSVNSATSWGPWAGCEWHRKKRHFSFGKKSDQCPNDGVHSYRALILQLVIATSTLRTWEEERGRIPACLRCLFSEDDCAEMSQAIGHRSGAVISKLTGVQCEQLEPWDSTKYSRVPDKIILCCCLVRGLDAHTSPESRKMPFTQ